MTSVQRKTFIASFLGWTLDAFDYFLVIVVVPHLAKDFNVDVGAVLVAVTLTLAMRPIGALIFGWIADRYGRRLPLMVDIGLYSILELATAFAPNLTVFLILRALFGIAMGGEWGLGSALAMESLPAKSRGLYSGILQEGYAVGYLLAGQALAWLYPISWIGWRGLFVVGALPAVLIFFIRAHVPESPVWMAGKHERLSLGRDVLLATLKRSWPLFLFGAVMMTAFNALSHGTQDIYPTFLKAQLHFDPKIAGNIISFASLGAILGGICFGALSQRIGRRWAIALAAVVGALVVPLWAFDHTIALVATGGFAMQFAVQGAWGIIPAHLNEIAPRLARGTFPGFVYQIGNLLSSPTAQIIAALAAGTFAVGGAPDYAKAMAVFTICALAAVIFTTLLGRFVVPENRDVDFSEIPAD
ncbi:MAG: MFS transporter [Candidatus Eremiobacteraeota bacterium]|nr:MFS transporter [Candidatus Eremiobacteraeota bacterium]